MFCDTCIHVDMCGENDGFTGEYHNCRGYRNNKAVSITIDYKTYEEIIHMIQLAKVDLSHIRK